MWLFAGVNAHMQSQTVWKPELASANRTSVRFGFGMNNLVHFQTNFLSKSLITDVTLERCQPRMKLLVFLQRIQAAIAFPADFTHVRILFRMKSLMYSEHSGRTVAPSAFVTRERLPIFRFAIQTGFITMCE